MFVMLSQCWRGRVPASERFGGRSFLDFRDNVIPDRKKPRGTRSRKSLAKLFLNRFVGNAKLFLNQALQANLRYFSENIVHHTPGS